MRFGILDFFGNFVNYLIFIYIFLNTINTSCFDSSDMSIALIGLILSVFIFIVNLIERSSIWCLDFYFGCFLWGLLLRVCRIWKGGRLIIGWIYFCCWRVFHLYSLILRLWSDLASCSKLGILIKVYNIVTTIGIAICCCLLLCMGALFSIAGAKRWNRHTENYNSI